MTARPAIDDAALGAMLAERADRARPLDLDPRSIAAAAGPRTRASRFSLALGSGLSVAGAALAVALLVVALAMGPLAARPTGSNAATNQPTGSAGLRSPGTTEPAVIGLTAVQLGDLVRMRSAELAGRVAIARTQLHLSFDPRCSGNACLVATLPEAGANLKVAIVDPTLQVKLGADLSSGGDDFDATAWFAVRFTDRVALSQPILEVLGVLVDQTRSDGTVTVPDLLAHQARPGELAAVDGWLVRGPFHPCGSDPRNPTVSYGCPTDDWLTESDYQPFQPDGSMVGPLEGVYLPSGSYDRWAHDPATTGIGGRGVEPREATYLLQFEANGCNGSADCVPPAARWRIVGSLDPIPMDVEGPSARPPSGSDAPAPSPSSDVQGPILTVTELLAQQRPVGRDVLVRGWLEASLTPGLRCAAPPPRPSGWPIHDCGRADWLTDEPFSPSPTWASPSVGLLAQSGAYDAFAPQPVWNHELAEPRLGTYVVRMAVHSTCEAVGQQPGSSCAGGPIWTFEVVARLDPPPACRPTNGTDVCILPLRPP